MDVFLTSDVEIWCTGWKDIDAKFPLAFKRYVYGATPRGDYGLPHQLSLLNEHGLTGVFFVEPLFAGRFGLPPLTEIVQLIAGAGQEVQLHLHTEWVDEARLPMLGGAPSTSKRPFLRQFSLDDQTCLIGIGKALLEQAGAAAPNAFRAGSFGMDHRTLAALEANGIRFDSSYNASTSGLRSGILPGQVLTDCIQLGAVHEYPMTVFDDGFGSLRHAQLTACSIREMESLLWQALERGQQGFVILSHNFELMNPGLTGADDIVIKRYKWLCEFLDRNRDCFQTRGFHGLEPKPPAVQPAALASTRFNTGLRMIEQFYRRKYV
ncbi:hypothetical protein LNV09_21375 [Paucibacter sp. B2R-40]|uniref:polysaccharide deacetylase family protein n=1 Tax=Paucibacter sp. B2R-40 TaxID=2893554 RepID=UPI0021E464A2|nr:hypothetical protein [Paucibacter sp. B2R-40]MCV2356699.1 hypothetical protein [Paucibacter sp. B2R-40]